ncbi:MAG: hypothetical protein QF394_13945, partial [Rhodospirillales bacterium]|nr:hypothetical protein [Rhodospirillales bacterium]
MFSPSTSFAEWTKVSENVGGTFYVDFERIRKHDGYVYFWYLIDYPEVDEYGTLSGKGYKQGDCKKFRIHMLSHSWHKEPMGGGTGDVSEPVKEVQGWMYPLPNSVDEIMLKSVCAYVK